MDIKRVWPHNLIINVQEISPSLYWSSENKIYWLNQDGIVIAANKPISNQIGLCLVVDKANVPVGLGSRIVTNQFINFVAEAKKGIEQQTNLRVSEIDIRESTYELFFIVDKGYYIRFNTQRDLKLQLDDLKVVLNKLASLTQKPAEYIDLRIEGRVFYK